MKHGPPKHTKSNLSDGMWQSNQRAFLQECSLHETQLQGNAQRMFIAESNLSSCFDRMRWVVLDEADLLMGGGFQRDVNAIIAAMRDEDTHSKAEIISARLGIPVDSFYAKPRGERKRVLQGKAMAHRGNLPLRLWYIALFKHLCRPQPPSLTWVNHFLSIALVNCSLGEIPSFLQSFQSSLWNSSSKWFLAMSHPLKAHPSPKVGGGGNTSSWLQPYLMTTRSLLEQKSKR